jgi:hypothetical protein
MFGKIDILVNVLTSVDSGCMEDVPIDGSLFLEMSKDLEGKRVGGISFDAFFFIVDLVLFIDVLLIRFFFIVDLVLFIDVLLIRFFFIRLTHRLEGTWFSSSLGERECWSCWLFRLILSACSQQKPGFLYPVWENRAELELPYKERSCVLLAWK